MPGMEARIINDLLERIQGAVSSHLNTLCRPPSTWHASRVAQLCSERVCAIYFN